MFAAAYLLSALGIIILPILLALYVTRRFSLPWKLIFAGGLTFIVSQIFHIPFLYGLTAMFTSRILPAIPYAWATLFNAVVLGLLAGIFEETARWILFKFILKGVRTWEEGIVVGSGYGGTEAIIIGALMVATLINMLVMRSADLSTMVPPAQLDLLQKQVAGFWSTPWPVPFLAFLERAFTICLQISLTIMVLYSVAYKKPAWFWIALFWHAFVDGFSVYLASIIGKYKVEAVVGVCAAISLVILFRLRPRFLQEPKAEAING
jgi:uncharacterized membrane protein YhfC